MEETNAELKETNAELVETNAELKVTNAERQRTIETLLKEIAQLKEGSGQKK